LRYCAVYGSGGDSTEAEKNVVYGICKFLKVVLYLAMGYGLQPVWPWFYILTGIRPGCVVISPSFYSGRIVTGICGRSIHMQVEKLYS
jgi:hypothetical protein